MEDRATPVLKDLVLLGGGHSHIIVLKRLGMNPIPGVRITLISRDLHAPYSGMLPGLIAGHYTFDEAHVDLAPLTRFAGARLFHDEAVGLDPAAQTVLCHGRPSVPYDVLSIDIGITPTLKASGALEHAVPVKPIGGLMGRWKALENRVYNSGRRLRVAVVGAGAAGVELTLAMQHAIQVQADKRASFEVPEFYLFGSSATVLPTHNRGAQARFERVIRERGIQLCLGHRVERVESDCLVTTEGRSFEVDEVVWATEAAPQEWLRDSGLAVDDQGFIEVGSTLQSTSHHEVFAAGDVASVVGYPREKAGVFAVRQGRPLERNLRRALQGLGLQPFRPQRRFLSLVSTGDQYAVASRGALSVEGSWVWSWKDWIDRRFMKRFCTLPEMDVSSAQDSSVPAGLAAPEVIRELSTAAMRCGGCGAKVGATMLSRVLGRLEPIRREDILVGLDSPDDASVESIPEGKLLVQSVDAFRSMVDDPYLFGRITANHCLSDLYAMGAEPRSALSVVAIPHGLEEKMEKQLEEVLMGGVAVLNEGGAALVGGHTSEGAELTLGFTVTGTIDRDKILRKTGLMPGDRIILTKPLGTGTLLAADMRGKAMARWVDGAIQSMLVSNRTAAEVVQAYETHACTDVTGFGLLGHLVEMTKHSNVDVSLALDSVPFLDGATATAGAGFLSSLQPQNIRLRRAITNVAAVGDDPRYPLLFDPQTAGGLLVAIPAKNAEACVAQLRDVGYEDSTLIGTVEPQSDRDGPITIEV